MNIQEQRQFFPYLQSAHVRDTSSEAMNEFYREKLVQIKNHSSKFNFIDKAIQNISENSPNAVRMLAIFNKAVGEYVIEPFPIISCLEELQELERQLEDCDSLKKLWDVLWCHALVDMADEPQVETVEQKRQWLKDNQSLLDEVTALELQGSNIVHLPKEIFMFHNLEKLDLCENVLKELPESIKVWRNLEELNLSCNELKCLPFHGIRHLKKLIDVDVSANHLTSLPGSIKYLKRLKKLNVEESDIIEIPQEIGQCTALEVLNVSSNELVELCVEIQNLPALKKFFASDNNLRFLPEELRSWKQIQKVDLSYNLLEGVTEEFIKALWPSVTKVSL